MSGTGENLGNFVYAVSEATSEKMANKLADSVQSGNRSSSNNTNTQNFNFSNQNASTEKVLNEGNSLEEKRINVDRKRNKIELRRNDILKNYNSTQRDPENFKIRNFRDEVGKRSSNFHPSKLFVNFTLALFGDITGAYLFWNLFKFEINQYFFLSWILYIMLSHFMLKSGKDYIFEYRMGFIPLATILKLLPIVGVLPFFTVSAVNGFLKYNQDIGDPTGEIRQERLKQKLEEKQQKQQERQRIMNDVNLRIQTTSRTKLWVVVIISVLWDTYDLISSVLTLGADKLATFNYGFGAVDLILNMLFYNLSGVYYSKVYLTEFIPGVDLAPLYSFFSIRALRKYNADVKLATGVGQEIKSGQKEINKTQKSYDGLQSRGLNINLNSQQSQWLKKVVVSLILFIIFSGVVLFFFTDSGPRLFYRTGERIGNLEITPENIFYDIQYRVLVMTNRIKERFDRQVKIASGETSQFAGQVDKLAKDLGLKLEIDGSSREYLMGQQITLFSTLSGRGLNPDVCSYIGDDCQLNQNIELFCSSGFGGLPGEMRPNIISFKEIEDSYYDASCTFKESVLDGAFKTGTTIYKTVLFDFVTLGYQRLDFVHDLKVRDLERENIKLERISPVYTPGPVSVEFGILRNYPVLVGDRRRQEFRFSIKNIGEGSIMKFEKIAFELPSGVVLEACNVPIIPSSNGFEINPDVFNERSYTLIEKGKNIEVMCSLDLSNTDILNLNSLYTTDSLNVLTMYKYRLLGRVPITIKKPDLVSELSDCTTECRNTAGCLCVGECSKNIFIRVGQTCALETEKKMEEKSVQVS